MWERTFSEAKGVGSYRSLSAHGGEVVRREVGWVDVTILDRPYVFLLERETPVSARFSDEPLTGKWMGAYSMKGNAVFFPGSDVGLDPLMRLFGETHPATVTRAVVSGWEGLLFGFGLVLGLTRRPR